MTAGAAAAARGGHEANDSYTFWAKLDPGALDRIVQHAGRMLQELFGAG